MSKFILGKKIGMTSIIKEDGNVIPATVLQAGPCIVTQVKSKEKDGYNAVQFGFGEKKKITKPMAGHLKSIGKNLRSLRELRTDEIEDSKVGDLIDVSAFEVGEKVKVSSERKAKGFAGVVKRWGFSGWPGSHGHPHQRRPGSIGSGYPQHVIKGRKMAGRMGPTRKTISNLEVIDIDKENNLIVVKGSVPGARGRLVEIRGS